MIEIVIIIFLGLILIGIGFIADRLLREDHKQYVYGNEKYVASWDHPKPEVIERVDKQEIPEMPLNQEDVINHEGVGIVHRPSAEEIEKMNKPQRVKDAEEAVAETIASVPEPEI